MRACSFRVSCALTTLKALFCLTSLGVDIPVESAT